MPDPSVPTVLEAVVAALFAGPARIMPAADGTVPAAADLPDDGGSATSAVWCSAIAKDPVPGPLELGPLGFAGDEQADRRVHGGPDKAVCCYPAAHYPGWRTEVTAAGSPVAAGFGPGAFGENVTVAEPWTEADVGIGDRFRLGTALVELSQPRAPCWKLGRRWAWPELTVRSRVTGRTGWYLRVLEPGAVEVGSSLVLVDRPHPEWTVAEANRVLHHDRDDLDAADRLSRCPALSAEWAQPLAARVARHR